LKNKFMIININNDFRNMLQGIYTKTKTLKDKIIWIFKMRKYAILFFSSDISFVFSVEELFFIFFDVFS